jgi:HemY protein
MIKLLWRFGLLLLAALFFTWLADRPGTVTIQWMGREIQMAFVIAVAIAFLAIALLWFVWGFFRRIWRSPTAARDYWRFRKNRKAYESLSRGIIAAGAGDSIAASKHAAIAGNALADEPLVNVLAAQAAQLKGDRASVKRIFEAMTKSPDTEALGLRGLFAEARQNGDVTSAMLHAERALKLNPRLAWASSAVLQLQSLRKDWSGAAATLQQQAKSGLIPTEESNQKQAIMLAAQAMAIEDKNSAEALTLALKSHKLDASLVPAALVAARVYASQNTPRKATKIIRETWSRNPHPDLAEVLAHARPGDGPEPRFERVRDLVGGSSDSLEGAYALARAAVAAQRWDAARKTLEPFLADQPQARFCALMADIEEATGDKGRAREWLARAIRAPRDPMWVSDGVASPRWVPISPVSGEIVPCQWKTPFEMVAEQKTETLAAPTPATAPVVESTPIRIAKPAMAELPRPPDDPGLDDDAVLRNRTLATDG